MLKMMNQITTLIRRHAVIRPRASKVQQSPLVRTFQYGVNLDQNLSQALRGSLSKQEHLILSSNLSPLLKVQRLSDSTYGLLKEWLGKHSHQVKVSERLAYQIKLLGAGSVQEMTEVAKEASGLQGQQTLKSINLLQSDGEAAFRHLQGLIQELERQKFESIGVMLSTKGSARQNKKLMKEGDKMLQSNRYLLEAYLALGRFEQGRRNAFAAQSYFKTVSFIYEQENQEQYLHPLRVKPYISSLIELHALYQSIGKASNITYHVRKLMILSEAILNLEKESYMLYPQVLKAASFCKAIPELKPEVNAFLDRLLKSVSKFNDQQAIHKITQSMKQ